jgi:hypothetical protein
MADELIPYVPRDYPVLGNDPKFITDELRKIGTAIGSVKSVSDDLAALQAEVTADEADIATNTANIAVLQGFACGRFQCNSPTQVAFIPTTAISFASTASSAAFRLVVWSPRIPALL